MRERLAPMNLTGAAACATKPRDRGLIDFEKRLVPDECSGIQFLPRTEDDERPAATSASARINDCV